MGLELRVLSDLHMEFGNFILPELPGDKNRVLVLAGDIGLSRKSLTYIPFLKAVIGQFRTIVWVFGNHEYYGDSIQISMGRVREALEEEGIADKIHILENDNLIIDGIAILGTTLWTDIGNSNPLAIATVKAGINDYFQIRTGPKSDPYKRMLAPAESIYLHQESRAWLLDEAKLQKNAGRKIIIVTHHLPLYESVPQHLRGNRLNPAFASNLEKEMTEIGAGLWIHGHTHFSVDYISPCGTRVVCNPRGYAGLEENPNFNPGLTIIVGDHQNGI
jgi:hypothetical protein